MCLKKWELVVAVALGVDKGDDEKLGGSQRMVILNFQCVCEFLCLG
jgi:hypothetical protein